MDRVVESQEELRGELGLLAERVDGLAADPSTSARLIASFTTARRRKDLILAALALAAMALAVAALVASLLGGSASP